MSFITIASMMKSGSIIILILVILGSIYRGTQYITGSTNTNSNVNSIYCNTQKTMIDLEYADDNESRIKGLMYRDILGTMSGMLFVYTGEEIRSFWMKNTYIPLDMMFLDHQMNIVSIYTGAKPEDLTPISSIYPAQYVLEVNSTWTAKHNIVIGCKLIIHQK